MKEKSLFIGSPKYKLIKDLVHLILSGCDVYYGLRCHSEFFEQVLVLLRAIAHREASLHGVELMPSLDLHRGQRHQRAMMDAMKGDLLDMDRNVVEAGVDEGAPSIDDIRGRVHR